MSSFELHVGNVRIGGGAPVSIQSMADIDTADVAKVLELARALGKAGCDILRVAVPNTRAVEALPEIISGSPIPIVADIHFDHLLALAAVKAGVHAVRINPGNIGAKDKVRTVAEACGEAGIPIRVGANSGSLPKGALEKAIKKTSFEKEAMAMALVDAAESEVRALEEFGFTQIKVSLKSSDVGVTVMANRMFAERCPNPLHLGVTEAGLPGRGTIKSAVGIGALLLDGIGDTIRVSLVSSPLEEVAVAKLILESVGARKPRFEIIACPTCGRKKIDVMRLAEKVEKALESLPDTCSASTTVAVMGCEVNGPGEAKAADFGVAGSSDGRVALFAHGEPLGTYPESDALDRLVNLIAKP